MSSFIDLFKGRSQKYIKRIPKAGGGYRYIYKEHHKGGVGAQEHMKEGAAFKLTFGGQKGHFHIVKAQGDKITVKHDELHGPDHKGVEMTKAELSELLTREHKPALEADAKKKRERVERMKRETPRHIGLKQAERLAKEAEARLGEDRKPQRSAGYASDELGQSNYEKHGGLLDQAAERAGVPVSRNNIGRSPDARIVRDNRPLVEIDSAAGIRRIFKDITPAQAQFIQDRAVEWLAANSGDSPAEIREHIEYSSKENQARAAQKYKDAAVALSEVIHATKDARGRIDNQQGTIKALEIIAEARKIGKQTPTPTPAQDTERPNNFETMPEGKAPDQIKRDLEPKTSAELARVFESELKRAGFKGVKTWIKNEGTPREIARIYVQGEQRGRRGQGYIDLPMSADALPSSGTLFTDDFKHPLIDLRNLPRLTSPQMEALIQAQARLSQRLKGKSQIIADPMDNRLIKLMLDYTQRATATPQELTNLIKQTADMKQISRDSLNRNQTLEHISAGLSRELVSRPAPTPTPTPAPDNFETMPEGERIANKAREAIERVKAHINELRDQHSVSLSEDEALEIDERILDAQLTLRKLEREELKARRAAAKEQAPKAQPIETPKPEPVKVAPEPAPEPAPAGTKRINLTLTNSNQQNAFWTIASAKGVKARKITHREYELTARPQDFENALADLENAIKWEESGRGGRQRTNPTRIKQIRTLSNKIKRAVKNAQLTPEEAQKPSEPTTQPPTKEFNLTEWLQDAPQRTPTAPAPEPAPAQEEAPKTPREQLIETAREATAPAPEPVQEQQPAPAPDQTNNPLVKVTREATRARLIDILQMTRELDDAELNDSTHKGLAFLSEKMSPARLARMPSAFSHWGFRQREAGEAARNNPWAKEFERYMSGKLRDPRANQADISDFIRESLKIKRLTDLKGKEAQIKEISARFARDSFTEAARIAEEAAHRGKAQITEEAHQALDYLVGQLKDAKARLENPRRGTPDPTAVKEHQEIIEIALQAREHYSTRAAQIKAQAFSRSAFLEALKTSPNARHLVEGRPDGIPARRKVEEIIQEAVQNELEQLINQYRQTDPAPLEPITDEAPAVKRLDQMIDQLAGIRSSAEERAVAADLPPKGQRTAEDARRFFGTPKKRSLATGGAVKVFERGNIMVRAYAKEGQRHFRANTPSGGRTFPTLDQALEYAVNQADIQ